MSMKKKKKRDHDDDDFWPARGSLFDEFFEFGDIDREFDRMREYMDMLARRAMEGNLDTQGQGPYVYGFSMRVGPDGKPQISEFGNTRPSRRLEPAEEEDKGEELFIAEREPLTDVIDCDDYISITLEIPGVEKDEIDLTVKEDKVSISVDTNNRRYFKEIPLSAKVNPNTSKATYRNGVLDITLKKLEPEKKKGKKVKIN